MAARPPSTVSIRRPCGVVLSAQGSLNDLNAVPAFVIASRVLLLFYLLAALVREAFLWRAVLAYPPSKSFAAGRASVLRKFCGNLIEPYPSEGSAR